MREVRFIGYAGSKHPGVIKGSIPRHSVVIEVVTALPASAAAERDALQARCDRGELAWFEEIGPEKVSKNHYPRSDATKEMAAAVMLGATALGSIKEPE